jgi:hypothetical protein
MNPAEVVKREPEHDSRAVILKLAAEAICQSGESANAHPHTEILSLDMRSANPRRVGLAYAYHCLSANHLSGRLASFAFRRGPVDLDELGKVYAIPE